MIKDDPIPNVGFVCQAFLYSFRFLLTHPVTLSLHIVYYIMNREREVG